MINSVKARTPIMALILFVFTFGQALAADKVVVIPMAADKAALYIDGSDYYSDLTEATTYIMSVTDVSLPVDSTCMVTTTGYVGLLDSGDNVSGPYFRTARRVGVGNPEQDTVTGGYALYVSGSTNSSSVSATHVWAMSANTDYRFGCSFVARPANWSDDRGYCRVSWVCSEN